MKAEEAVMTEAGTEEEKEIPAADVIKIRAKEERDLLLEVDRNLQESVEQIEEAIPFS
jgi:hypothetical protein